MGGGGSTSGAEAWRFVRIALFWATSPGKSHCESAPHEEGTNLKNGRV